MAYDLYPAVDENIDFAQIVRQRLAISMELRNMVVPMTTVLRNNLMPSELWDGRLIVNTDNDHIERYDATAAQWYQIPNMSDILTQAIGDARYVNTSGDEMTGSLIFNGSNRGLAFLPADAIIIQGSTGNDLYVMDYNGGVYRCIHVGDPTHPQHAATKNYVDRKTRSGTVVGTTDANGELGISFGVVMNTQDIVAGLGDYVGMSVAVIVLAGTVTPLGFRVRLINHDGTNAANIQARVNWIAHSNN